ncbi:hypothetical protein BKA62DRAFT_719170 [Auriculariales sp. MPI-PUGE-AT-0066]|nr:hypothetical protein BKA62DRAFT_719170 [Auriculariales sp. MPI-PUGE-AT-0066]
MPGLASLHNGQQPISGLPREVLASVAHFIPTNERGPLALCSRLWRDTLLSSPYIWTDIFFNPDESQAGNCRTHAAFQQLLQLSGACELHLTVELSNDETCNGDIFYEVRINLGRVKSLQVRIPPEYEPSMFEEEELELFLTTPAPRLESFELYDYGEFASLDFGKALHLFGDISPMLREFKGWSAISKLTSEHALRLVRSASLTMPESVDHQCLATIIQLFPVVRYIGLEIATLVPTTGWDGCTPIELPSFICQLDIMYYDRSHEAIRLLSALSWGHVHSVTVDRYPSGMLDEAEVLELLNILSGSLDVPKNHQSTAFVSQTAEIGWFANFDRSTIEAGVCVWFSDLPYLHVVRPARSLDQHRRPKQSRTRAATGINISLPSSPFAHIVRLYLYELVLDPEMVQHPLPQFNSVRDLYITISSTRLYKEEIGLSPFLEVYEPTLPQRIIVCPALVTLTFGASRSEWINAVASPCLEPETAARVIRRHIVYQRNRLERLTFLGIHMVSVEPKGLHSLLELAETVDFDENVMVVIEEYVDL